MSRRKSKFVPEPRVLSDYQVACRFNKSEDWFREHRAELEAEGFPTVDPLLGGRDGVAIERWFDARSGLFAAAPANPWDKAMEHKAAAHG